MDDLTGRSYRDLGNVQFRFGRSLKFYSSGSSDNLSLNSQEIPFPSSCQQQSNMLLQGCSGSRTRGSAVALVFLLWCPPTFISPWGEPYLFLYTFLIFQSSSLYTQANFPEESIGKKLPHGSEKNFYRKFCFIQKIKATNLGRDQAYFYSRTWVYE